MNYRVRFIDPARTEYLETLRSYRDDSPNLAQAFAAEFRRVATLLERYPMLGAPHYNEARRKLLSRFPYAIVYLIEDHDLVVVAVAHQRRRPFYWSDRLNEGGGS